MIFDTHPCTTQGAQRAYGSRPPSVCTINEYSDIFASATEALNYPVFCCGPPNHADLLQKLQSQYPYLGIAIRDVLVGGRWIVVLAITRKQQQPTVLPAAAPAVATTRYDLEVPSSTAPLPPPVPPPAIPIVQAIPLDERK